MLGCGERAESGRIEPYHDVPTNRSNHLNPTVLVEYCCKDKVTLKAESESLIDSGGKTHECLVPSRRASFVFYQPMGNTEPLSLCLITKSGALLPGSGVSFNKILEHGELK